MSATEDQHHARLLELEARVSALEVLLCGNDEVIKARHQAEVERQRRARGWRPHLQQKEKEG